MTNERDPSQEFVYIRTYARWRPELGRREISWENETVPRIMQFLRDERGMEVQGAVMNKIERAIKNMDVMPSMRLAWAAGEAAKRDNTTLYNCSFACINSIKSFAECLYILMCGTGYGYRVIPEDVEKLPVIPNITSDGNGQYIIPDTTEGWADSLKELMTCLYAGKDLEMDYSRIRPKGAKLKTKGGTASGPEPLRKLHEFVRQAFFSAQGRKLTTIEVSDICNTIAEVVVVGGVRRSSQIALTALDDESMRYAKQAPFPPRRYMANFSAIYEKKPSATDFLKEWAALAASGSGERGIFNLETARKKAPRRRDGRMIKGTNPCVTGDTRLLTKNGLKRIDSLINTPIEVWNGFEWSEVIPRITGENQQILKIKFSDGRELKCTPYHKFHISTDYKGSSCVKEAKDLILGDKLIKCTYPVVYGGKEGNLCDMYTQGFYSADGTKDRNHFNIYGEKLELVKYMNVSQIGNPSENYYGTKREIYKANFELKSKTWVPCKYTVNSRLAWLAGLFDGDGCELKEGGCQIASIDRDFLHSVQSLLMTLGVNSKLVPANKSGYRKLPDQKGGLKEFYCQEVDRLCIGAVEIQELKSLGMSCKRLKFNKEPQRNAGRFTKVTSIEELGLEEFVYCFNEPNRNLGVFDGVITGQCGEISLMDREFCNLTEVVIKEGDSLDSVLEKVHTATWLGCIQSTFTKFPYLDPTWKENCEEERLLGVSLTGQMDNPHILCDTTLKELKRKAYEVAKNVARALGINIPVAITCVKPSGTVSQLVNSSSGIHARFAPYYIRRYRISAQDPLYRMMRAQHVPFLIENGQTKEDWEQEKKNRKRGGQPGQHCTIYEEGAEWSEDKVNTFVVEFPIKSPEGSICRKDMTVIEQLEWYKMVQANWCEHNASNTIYVKDEEWFEVGNWVYQNWEYVCGLSFLPYDGGKYRLPPYEEITMTEYEYRKEHFPDIDYSKLQQYEQDDQGEGAQTPACEGDKCILS